jgi:hypothetical protein
MSQAYEEKRALYEKTMVKKEERAWFVDCVGFTMEPERKAAFLAIHRVVWQNEGKKEPWNLFRFGIEHDPNNEHDENAVVIFCWRQQKDGSWTKLRLGHVPSKDPFTKKACHANVAVKEWLETGQVWMTAYKKAPNSDETFDSRLVRLVYIWWDDQKKFGRMKFAIHTSVSIKELPRGVLPIESFSPGSAEAPKAKAPPVESGDYPTTKQIEKLLELQGALSQLRYESPNGLSAATFISQWDSRELSWMKFASQSEFDTATKGLDVYSDPVAALDLPAFEKEYGPVAAQNVYKLSGIYAGPFIRLHVAAVIANASEVVMVLKKFKSPVV